MKQQREPHTVSQLLTQIQQLQDKRVPCLRRENFIILKQRAALERPPFPVIP